MKIVINHLKTWERCKLINLAQVGRMACVPRQAVDSIVKGTYGQMRSPNARAVLDILRRHNVLVEEEIDDEAA